MRYMVRGRVDCLQYSSSNNGRTVEFLQILFGCGVLLCANEVIAPAWQVGNLAFPSSRLAKLGRYRLGPGQVQDHLIRAKLKYIDYPRSF
jgi:hypothetical protein